MAPVAIEGTAGASTAAVQRIFGGDERSLGDIFLRLLVTQLKYQDPLNAMDNQEFVGQLAQLTLLEQVQAMAEAMESSNGLSRLGQASALIGRSVTGTSASGEPVEGVVQGILLQAGEPLLDLGTSQLPLDRVFRVG